MISVTPDGALAKTILELAKEQGKSTGLVATSRITHATPAAFGGHQSAREDEDEIALWMLANEVDVLIGGGRRHFLPDSGTGGKEWTTSICSRNFGNPDGKSLTLLIP